MVGLRWWSTINEQGKETWHFESQGENANQNKVDKRVFWTSQYLFGGLWAIFAVVSLLSFNFTNMVVCTVSFGLIFTNTTGYIKCDKNHQQGMSKYLFKKATDNLSAGQITKIGMYAASKGAAQ